MSEPDEGETKVRAALHRLGARPAGHVPADDAEQQPAPVAVVIPPRPEHEIVEVGRMRFVDLPREQKIATVVVALVLLVAGLVRFG